MTCNVEFPMKAPDVRFSTPYGAGLKGDERYSVEWPSYWPIPRVGDEVTSEEGSTLWVRSVNWYPHGEDAEDTEPFIYIVLSNRPVG